MNSAAQTETLFAEQANLVTVRMTPAHEVEQGNILHDKKDGNLYRVIHREFGKGRYTFIVAPHFRVGDAGCTTLKLKRGESLRVVVA